MKPQELTILILCSLISTYKFTSSANAIWNIIETFLYTILQKMNMISNNDNEIYNTYLLSAYFLPEWCPASTYVREAKALGLEDVRQVELLETCFNSSSNLFLCNPNPLPWLDFTVRTGWLEYVHRTFLEGCVYECFEAEEFPKNVTKRFYNRQRIYCHGKYALCTLQLIRPCVVFVLNESHWVNSFFFIEKLIHWNFLFLYFFFSF